MKLVSSLSYTAEVPSVVALGFFDGVHLGHRAVLSRAKTLSLELGCDCTVWTFASSPKNYFSPRSVPQLTDGATKARLIEELGADTLVSVPFDQAVADLSAEDFFHRILKSSLRASHIVCGYNYSFGAGGRGNVTLLESLCRTAGIGLTVLPAVTVEGMAVSSTMIRRALEEGRPEEAAKLLGRPFSIRTPVVDGQRLGRRLGFPTLNQLLEEDRLLPARGVYLSRVTLEGDSTPYFGITNLGRRPTVGGDFLGAETHIFDFSGDLYGTTVEVALLTFLRPERKFDSVEALSRQVHDDIEQAIKMADKFNYCQK